MIRHAVFVQECPVCGRPLEIRNEYVGRKVSCQHCGGSFTAMDGHEERDWCSPRERMLKKADQLLKLSSEKLSGRQRVLVG